MDTTLENQRVKPIHILSYGFVAEIIPIALLVIWHLVSVGSLSVSQGFMEDTGFLLLLTTSFFSFMAIAFWIARNDRHKTFLNGVFLVIVGIVLELFFYWIINVEFRVMFIFSFLGKFLGVILAGVTPVSLKGTKERRPSDDHDHKKLP